MILPSCFFQDSNSQEKKIPIHVITFTEWESLVLSECEKNWLNSQVAKPAEDSFYLLPDEKGCLAKIIYISKQNEMPWSFAALYNLLPSGCYEIITTLAKQNYFLVWGLQAYRFDQYLTIKKDQAKPKLLFTEKTDYLIDLIHAIYLTRDLINTPTEDLSPQSLAEISLDLAKSYNAQSIVIEGDALLSQGYPTVHMVGRASTRAPCLIDFSWGELHHPKVTLVGKGVCFDSGGLNIKPGKGMLLMKKDMGGAAHVLGLAQLIMQQKLPIRLRVLIPAVENAISGNAFRPGDIVRTRKGITVEISNTDAEGRLILADALVAANEEDPELIFDFATLTGAARVALGTELPAIFCSDLNEATQLLQASQKMLDPLWLMPLHQPYRALLNSSIADINHVGDDSYGGAILAALFLQEFVKPETKWFHLDLMAWNLRTKPGRPEGGEAMGLRAVFEYLRQRFER